MVSAELPALVFATGNASLEVWIIDVTSESPKDARQLPAIHEHSARVVRTLRPNRLDISRTERLEAVPPAHASKLEKHVQVAKSSRPDMKLSIVLPHDAEEPALRCKPHQVIPTGTK